MAATIKRIGFTYVGISLDGVGAINDKFRGVEGAFNRAVTGIRNCKAVGQRVGLRMTLTDHNIDELPAIFDFVEAEGIDRICFYHLVYSGRGGRDPRERPDPQEDPLGGGLHLRPHEAAPPGRQERRGPDRRQPRRRPLPAAEAARRRTRPQLAEVENLLRRNGGALSSSGIGIGNIDFIGNVHPDQFWMHYTLGNVRQRPFSEIWQDESEPLLAGLRNRAAKVHGRCRSCKFWDMCGGALRVRADLGCGDPWAPDPACYLTDEEIGLL